MCYTTCYHIQDDQKSASKKKNHRQKLQTFSVLNLTSPPSRSLLLSLDLDLRLLFLSLLLLLFLSRGDLLLFLLRSLDLLLRLSAAMETQYKHEKALTNTSLLKD